MDVTGFERAADDCDLAVTIRPIMNLDAIAAYPDADLLGLLVIDDGEHPRRIAARDSRWGTDVSTRWDHLQLTWEAAWGETRPPDVAIDASRPIDESAAVLATTIRERMTG